MARDWSEERWIKVFLCDSPRWLALPWQARGLYGLLQRIADRDGVIDTGPDQRAAVAVAVRAPVEEVAAHLQALERVGLVVVRPEAIELPEHAEQQASRASGAARQREYRRRVTAGDAVVTQSDAVVTTSDAVVTAGDELVTSSDARRHILVTRSDDKKDKKEKIREDEKRADARGRARVAESKPAAAAPIVDPKARRIALELAANAKFASLDAHAVASELLGALGPLGFALTDERIDQAIAQAAAEAETGAPERRLRQVLTWKLKDAATGGKRGHHPPQGVDEKLAEDVARTMARVERDRLEREARPPIPEEFQL